MYLRESWFVPTLNFEPYFQKGPLLFWLIDLGWEIFGVSRAAALVVIFAISASIIYLTQRLSRALFPNMEGMAERAPWLLLGSVPFLIYASLIFFDLLLTALVVASFLALIRLSKDGDWRHAALAGLFLGLCLLAKGPVVFIHVGFPVAFYSLWRDPVSSITPRQFYRRLPIAVLVAAMMPVAWLGLAFHQAGWDYAYNLVWRQAAGRISGSLEGAHVRPFYFYLLLLPVMLLPWVLSWDMWRLRPVRRLYSGEGLDRGGQRILLFLGLWLLLELVLFSLISGKQPHYLMPLLPVLIVLFAYLMAAIPFKAFPISSGAMVALFCVGQLAVFPFLPERYDLEPLAEFVAGQSGADWGFAGHYQGQVGFLSRAEKPVANVDEKQIDEWLQAHPKGYVIARASCCKDRTSRIVFGDASQGRSWIILGGELVSRR
nr:glycosyltransferase family 39 protein [Pseudaminobacter soli]